MMYEIEGCGADRVVSAETSEAAARAVASLFWGHPVTSLEWWDVGSDGATVARYVPRARVVLLNTSILTCHGSFTYQPLLGVPVPVNRIQYEQTTGDLAVVFKLRGRPPEGKILTAEEIEAIGYDFGLLTLEPTPEQVVPPAVPGFWLVGSAQQWIAARDHAGESGLPHGTRADIRVTFD